jgi:hypothetical protein
LRWYMYSNFNNKLKEEIKNDRYRAISKNSGIQSTWNCPDQTAKPLGITYTSVSKYWNMSQEDYTREAEQESTIWIISDSTY